jgi:carbon storage regulator
MLVLSRTAGEEVLIGHNIRLIVLAIRGNRVRLGFTAPKETPILREELCHWSKSCDRRHSPVPAGIYQRGPGQVGPD